MSWGGGGGGEGVESMLEANAPLCPSSSECTPDARSFPVEIYILYVLSPLPFLFSARASRVNWEESTYLNYLMHNFTFNATTAICYNNPTPVGKSRLDVVTSKQVVGFC